MDEIPPCEIRIDKDGVWYYKGAEIIHKDIIQLFYEHLEVDAQGRIIIHWRGQRCYLEVEDAPFVVVGLRPSTGPEGGLTILLNDGSKETLDPTTLLIDGDSNIPYCRVRDGKFTARFSRKAYYELINFIHQDDDKGGYFILIGGRRFPLRFGKPG